MTDEESRKLVALADAADDALEIAGLAAEVKRLTEDNAHLNVQLAGCSVAALGDKTAFEVKSGDYAHSASLGDVCELRRRYDDLVSGDAYLQYLTMKKLEREARLDPGMKDYLQEVQLALEQAQVYLRAHDCFEQECGTCQVLAQIKKVLGT